MILVYPLALFNYNFVSMAIIPRKFWPYDEVKVTRDVGQPSRFTFAAPWLKLNLNVKASEVDRADAICHKLNASLLEISDLDEVTWLLASVAKYPMAYILPRADNFGSDSHNCVATKLNLASPITLLESLAKPHASIPGVINLIRSPLESGWTWDAAVALEFSKTSKGYDPESLFSVVRRYHLLNDLENNKTGDLFNFLGGLKNNPEKFRKASALVIRQNHYITQQCEGVLRSSLPLAGNAEHEVLEFIRAESGHDKILEHALNSMDAMASETDILDSAIVLMEVFRWAGQRNLLGFAMITDIFERTSYHEKDPLATLLEEGGQSKASQQIDKHRVINDMGEHENVALGFLHAMRPIDEDYAREALRLAELATLVVHRVSPETLNRLA